MASNKKDLIEYNYAKDEIPESVKLIINEYFSNEADEIRKSSTINFMARALIVATMPHKDPKSDIFTRTNGAFTLRMLAGSSKGLPFGVYPRLLMSWITSEAVRTKSPVIELNESLGDFLKYSLDLKRGGANRRLLDQMARLFGTHITASTAGNAKHAPIRLNNVVIADEAEIYPEEVRELWTPQTDHIGEWKSKLVLNPRFFSELITSPVPIDITAFKVLNGSPLAMDLYTFLTYRYSYLERPTTIPWVSLQNQLGSNYAFTPEGTRDFKNKGIIPALEKIHAIYPEAKFMIEAKGLTLLPSRPHVAKVGFASTQKRLF